MRGPAFAAATDPRPASSLNYSYTLLSACLLLFHYYFFLFAVEELIK